MQVKAIMNKQGTCKDFHMHLISLFPHCFHFTFPLPFPFFILSFPPIGQPTFIWLGCIVLTEPGPVVWRCGEHARICRNHLTFPCITSTHKFFSWAALISSPFPTTAVFPIHQPTHLFFSPPSSAIFITGEAS